MCVCCWFVDLVEFCGVEWFGIDESSVSEIEEESDGVWGIVGGKVRNMFLILFYAFFFVVVINHKEKVPD